MQFFYHLFEGEKTGPFDAVSMIRRIKNGKLQPQDSVFVEESSDPVSANSIALFHEYFAELTFGEAHDKKAPIYPRDVSTHATNTPSLSALELLKLGLEKLLENQRSAVLVALGIAAIILLALGLKVIAGALLSSLFCGAAIGCLLMLFYFHCAFTLRGEDDSAFIVHFKQPAFRTLLALSGAAGALLIGVPFSLWSLLGALSLVVTLIGLLAFTLLLATPALWLNTAQPIAVSALTSSAAYLLALPKPQLFSLMALQALVFLSMLVFLFPLVMTLPIVGYAWMARLSSAQTNQ